MDEIEVTSSSGPLLLFPMWVCEKAAEHARSEPLLSAPTAHVIAVYLLLAERDAPHCGVMVGEELGLSVNETAAALDTLRAIGALAELEGDVVGVHIEHPDYRASRV